MEKLLIAKFNNEQTNLNRLNNPHKKYCYVVKSSVKKGNKQIKVLQLLNHNLYHKLQLIRSL